MAQRGRPSDEGDRIQTRADLIEALTEGVKDGDLYCLTRAIDSVPVIKHPVERARMLELAISIKDLVRLVLKDQKEW